MRRKKNTKRYFYIFSLFLIVIVLIYLGLQSLPDIDKVFDYLKKLNIPISERDVRVYFSPDGGAQDAIINGINEAEREVLIAMYYFTSRPIAQALVSAKDRRIDIKVVLDESQVKEKFSKYRYLLKNGIKIKIDYRNGLMHNKFMIVDGKLLFTGSYNWTSSAEHKNRENLIIIKNRAIAQRYIWEFNKLWAMAK